MLNRMEKVPGFIFLNEGTDYLFEIKNPKK